MLQCRCQRGAGGMKKPGALAGRDEDWMGENVTRDTLCETVTAGVTTLQAQQGCASTDCWSSLGDAYRRIKDLELELAELKAALPKIKD